MTESRHHEKRQLQRLLCSENFSNCLLKMGDTKEIAKSINYNRNGIGIFVNERLPRFNRGEISFSYLDGDGEIEIHGLPFLLVYVNETEVGAQYGLKFELETVTQQTLDQLRQIETALSLEANTNRYGL